jgi:transposase
MRTKKYKVYLTETERQQLLKTVKNGNNAASKITRANILLHLDENVGQVKSRSEIALSCRVSAVTVYNVAKAFTEKGIDEILTRKKRKTPPITPIMTGDVEARIIALACGEVPKGFSRWTLRLLEKKIVELGIADHISDNTVGRLLKKLRLNLIKKSVGVYHQSTMPRL